MKTDDLITCLAGDARAVEPGTSMRRIRNLLGWGLFGSTLLMAVAYGVRPDIHQAMHIPMFWFKLALPFAVAVLSFVAVERLGRPGMRLGCIPYLFIALLAALWIAVAATLYDANMQTARGMILGASWTSCALSITLLAAPVWISAMWAMKGLAPTRPALAGGAAGLLAGAFGALVYALHCGELALPFVGVWYVLGMLIPAAIGMLVGGKWLRW